MVRFCLTVLMVAVSSWSEVWGSLEWIGDGLPGRWKTFRRHLVTKVSIPPFAYMQFYLKSLYQITVTAIPGAHVAPNLFALTKHGSKEIPTLPNKRSRALVPSCVIEAKVNRCGVYDRSLGNQAKCDFVSEHVSRDLFGAEKLSDF